MNIIINKVTADDKERFERLFQLFAYDFSELNGMDIGEDGKYYGLNDMDDYYSKPNYCSYFVKVDDKLAGLAVLRFDEDCNYFRHFFILRKYRGRKVGQQSVNILFDKYPGKWKVSPFDFNKPAIKFWSKVFNDYTRGKYITHRRADDKGPEFLFCIEG